MDADPEAMAAAARNLPGTWISGLMDDVHYPVNPQEEIPPWPRRQAAWGGPLLCIRCANEVCVCRGSPEYMVYIPREAREMLVAEGAAPAQGDQENAEGTTGAESSAPTQAYSSQMQEVDDVKTTSCG